MTEFIKTRLEEIVESHILRIIQSYKKLAPGESGGVIDDDELEELSERMTREIIGLLK